MPHGSTEDRMLAEEDEARMSLYPESERHLTVLPGGRKPTQEEELSRAFAPSLEEARRVCHHHGYVVIEVERWEKAREIAEGSLNREGED